MGDFTVNVDAIRACWTSCTLIQFSFYWKGSCSISLPKLVLCRSEPRFKHAESLYHFLVKLKEKTQGTAVKHTVRVYGSELILPKYNTMTKAAGFQQSVSHHKVGNPVTLRSWVLKHGQYPNAAFIHGTKITMF